MLEKKKKRSFYQMKIVLLPVQAEIVIPGYMV